MRLLCGFHGLRGRFVAWLLWVGSFKRGVSMWGEAHLKLRLLRSGKNYWRGGGAKHFTDGEV
jgi:hypothetical protein